LSSVDWVLPDLYAATARNDKRTGQNH
jgi:hypothetical protein